MFRTWETEKRNNQTNWQTRQVKTLRPVATKVADGTPETRKEDKVGKWKEGLMIKSNGRFSF